MSQGFNFKQFRINHDQCAMKVGTDGVLLGAWADLTEANTILDIGTGSGLIAIMAAQRNSQAMITGVEIDENASMQAKENKESCAWSDRIRIINSPLQTFLTPILYDHIISNPPFHNSHFGVSTRLNARQQQSLNYGELLYYSTKLLSPSGRCSFIVPDDEKEMFLLKASESQLFPNKICIVRSLPHKNPKRVLVELRKTKSNCVYSELTIEIEHHSYTSDFIRLVKSFYLHL